MKKKHVNQSRIWTLSKDDFQKLVDESNSIKMVMDKLCLVDASGSRRIIKKRFEIDNIDLSKLNEASILRRSEIMSDIHTKGRIPDEKVFVENSEYLGRVEIKQRMLDLGFKYECGICKISDWLNTALSLQLDHINGINNDNRIENLRFLCPNCHSQTDTFCGKHKKRKESRCCFCKKEISKQSVSCRDCCLKNRENKTKIQWPSKEFLEKRLWEVPTSVLAKELGVSDVAVSKHAAKLSITKPGRGYWEKLRSENNNPN